MALPKTDMEPARVIAEGLRATISDRSFTHEWHTRGPIPFTVSIGVATRLDDERDVWTIVKRADQALYTAKEAGRNRVETSFRSTA